MPEPVETERFLAADAPDHLPFSIVQPPPFRWRVGTRPVAAAEWLEVDSYRDRELALKQRVLGRDHDHAVAVLPGSRTASAEVLDAVVEHLATIHDITAQPDAGLHPIDAAGRLVQEDLCLHLERDGQLVLVAASVCFVQEWDVTEKLGRPLREIHEPVPGYDHDVADAVDRLLAGLRENRVLERRNWSLNPVPDRFQPARRASPDEPITLENAGSRLWLRIERQTLRRFAASASVLFTIRTYQRRLDALANRPEVCRDLAAAIKELPPGAAAYKGFDTLGEAALDWLEARS